MFDLKTRILIVDDMTTVRKMVAKACRELGFSSFLEAENGIAAWEALTSANPAVGIIISDWNMPESTGIDLLKRVRADNRYKSLPFLLVTAETEKDQVAEAIAAGVSHYITKPFTPDVIKDRLLTVYKKVAA